VNQKTVGRGCPILASKPQLLPLESGALREDEETTKKVREKKPNKLGRE